VAEYQKALKAANPDAQIGFVSLEGYMVGRLVVEALGKVKDPVTRAGLLSTIKEVGTFDLGGITLSYGPNDNQGMDQVFLTVIQADGSFKSLTAWSIDAAHSRAAYRLFAEHGRPVRFEAMPP
jgi:ABC-type branched-subunit amino acid transport system substrate-binding protein